MTRHSRKKFEVYEFREDDELTELDNQKFLTPHRNRYTNTARKSRDDSPINKYSFLQSVASGDQDYRGESTVVDVEDVDAIDKSCKSANVVTHLKTSQLEDDTLKVETLNAQRESIGTVSSEPGSIEACSATLTFCDAGNQVLLEKQLSEPDSGGCKIDDKNRTVKIFPSIIMYRDVPLLVSSLTFSCGGIKLEGSILNASLKTLCSEWTIFDVMSIKSEWTASVNMAMVCLYLRSEDFKGLENTNKTSGVEQLRFSFYDPNWAKGEDAIKALDVRYKDLWNIDIDVDMLNGGKELLGQHISMSSPTQHVSGSGELLEEITYPKGDPDAIIISERDIERLKPETFINDTIIDFYIKYLASNIQSKDKQRFHFFNSFFFRKLADLDKDPSSAYEGTIAFQRVRKWTRKVNIFEKDYIFIPVNYSLHWSLLVICHPGEVPNFKDEEYDSTSKVPCILHMDSIRGSHKGLKNLIQRYLCEEWKERHSDSAADVSSKFLTLRFVLLELPQQENFFDCGLFLLHYVERFLEEAPINFNPFNITKFSSFLSIDWFPPQEASLKRYLIKNLIYKIRKDHSQNSPSADNEVLSRTVDQEADVIVLEQICESTKTCRGISSEFNAEQLGMPLSKLKLRGYHCSIESGFVSSELLEPGACSSSNSDVDDTQSPSQHINYMSPPKEVEEIAEQVAESPLDMEECELVADLETLGLAKENSVFGTSCGSPILSWVGVNMSTELNEESSSSPWKDLEDCVVRDSEDEQHSAHDCDEVRHVPLTSLENNLDYKKDRSSEVFSPKGKSVSRSRDDASLGLDEMRRAKRNRLVRSEGRRHLLR